MWLVLVSVVGLTLNGQCGWPTSEAVDAPAAAGARDRQGGRERERERESLH